MYSDQQSAAMRFAVHVDGTSDQLWTPETVLSGPRLADDHINLKSIATDSTGRIYAATKTSVGDPHRPAHRPADLRQLARPRRQPGRRSSPARCRKPTRPQLAIDTTNRALYLVMASPDVGGGIVYYKRSSLDNLSFPTARATRSSASPGSS